MFRFDIQQKKRKRRKKTFALREMMMRKAHFFLTYSFPFRGGHPFFKRMTMCRASRTTTTTTTTTTLCASLQRERVRRGSPPKEFFPKFVLSFVLKEKLTKSVRRSFYLLLSNNTLFHQTKTEAKNEQTRRG